MTGISIRAARRIGIRPYSLKIKKPAPNGSHLDQGHPVHDGPHGVLADAEVEVAAAVAVGLEIARPLEGHVRLGRGGEIGGASDQPGDVLGDRVQNLARRDARRHPLGVGGEDRQVFIPAIGKLAVLDSIELVGQVGMFRLVAVDRGEPGVAQLLAAARRCPS